MDLRNDQDTIDRLQQKGQKMVEYAQGEALAAELGAFKYVEVSSLKKEGVNEVFAEGVRCAMTNDDDDPPPHVPTCAIS